MHAFAPLAIAGIVLIAAGAVLPTASRNDMIGILRRVDLPQLWFVLLSALLIYWASRIFLDGRA